MTPIEVSMENRIRNRLWNLEVGLVKSVTAKPASSAYVIEFAHTVNAFAQKRITEAGFEIVGTITASEGWLRGVNPHTLEVMIPERWQPAKPISAPDPVITVPVAAWQSGMVAVIADGDDTAESVSELDTLRAENTTLKARIAELESELGIGAQPLPAAELMNTELKKYNGEAADIIEIRPPRKMIVNDKYYAFIGVFMDVDGKTEVHAKVYPEVLNALVAGYGYAASSFRSSPRKLRAPVGCVLEWNDKVGLKVKEFDKPVSAEKAA